MPSSSALCVSTLENCQHPPALQPYTGFTGFLIVRIGISTQQYIYIFNVLCAIFKVFTEFVGTLFLVYVLVFVAASHVES